MMRNPATGFSATLYRDGEGGYVLAYRGSNSPYLRDYLLNNLPNAAGIPTSQGAQAIQLAQHVAGRVGAENLRNTGHSLGGHLATAAAIATGTRAVTFNSAGIGDGDLAMALRARGDDGNVPQVLAKTAARLAHPTGPFHLYDPHAVERAEIAASGQIRNYSSSGDPLGRLQRIGAAPLPIGEQVRMRDPDPVWYGDRHGPSGLLDTYDHSFGRSGRP